MLPKSVIACLAARKLLRAHATALIASVIAGSTGLADPAAVPAPDYLFNDSHFHLTNYVQKGTDIHKYLEIMGDKIGRSTLFGIPLQQMWSYANSGDFAPTYYLQTDAPFTTTPLPTR
jgi:hypothetical protein